MAFVPGYQWDAFVSYGHVDDTARDASPGWVTQFSEELERSLSVLTGRPDSVRLFRDTALRRDDRFSIALDHHLQSSATLIAIVSPGFDASVFCQRELAMFEGAVRREGNCGTLNCGQRIVPVRLNSSAGIRPIFSEVEGHDFADPGSAFPIDPEGSDFVRKVREVAIELVRILDQVAIRAAESEAATPWLSPAERGQLTAILRAPVLRLQEEDQRTTLLARAFGSRAPSLYARVRRLGGSVDDWIWALLDQLEDYGIVDDTDAASLLLDTLLSDGLVNAATLQECREATCAAWAAQERYLPPSEEVQKPERRGRLIGSGAVEVAADDPLADLSPGWTRLEDGPWRRVLLARGHHESAKGAGVDPAGLRAILAFHHPHVLPTVDYLLTPGTIISEHPWRPGRQLATSDAPMSLEEAVECVAQIADAVDVAHGHGLLHGQLDPNQVIIDANRRYATVTGFGFIAVPEDGRPLRVWRAPAVAPAYIAPEALRGAPVPASDQYSLAMLLYAMLIGNSAAVGQSEVRELGSRHAPEPLVWVVDRALAENPDERFSSAMELADAMRSTLQTGGSASAERAAEHRYLDAMRRECMDALRGYVTLRGSRTGARPDPERPPLTGAGLARVRHPVLYRISDAHASGEPRISEDVSEDLQASGRILLLGEPGSGKTTTLLHAAQEAARLAQRDPDAPIPVVLPLNSYDGSESVHDFAKAQMLELGHEPRHLLKDGRLLYFCDGLNEAPARARERFLEFAQKTRNFVVSCRTRDYEQDLQEVSLVTTVSILPLDPARIERALESILGPPGVELWATIGGCPDLISRLRKMRRQGEEGRFWDPVYVPGYTSPQEDAAWDRVRQDGVMELCCNPFLLRVVAELYLAKGTIPRSRSSIFKVSVETLLRRELDRQAASPDSALEEGIDEETVVEALTAVAELIQSRHLGVGVEAELATAKIGSRWGAESAEAILRLAEDASILSRRGERLGFSHQLLQEYFAGRIMRKAFERSESPRQFFPNDGWWRSHGWEETAVILAGSIPADDRDRFVRWLAPAHPPLLVRCLEGTGIAGWNLQTLSEETRNWLRLTWVEWVADETLDPAARAAILRALAAIGDPRPGVGTSVAEGGERPDIAWVELPERGISISRYPITVAQFACGEDGDWPADAGTTPQTGISWEQACDYCARVSELLGEEIRLPTAAEWTEAARLAGQGEDSYPWGPDWIAASGNVADGSDGDIGSASPVGAFDDLRFPLADAIGNVWEWCLDEQSGPAPDAGEGNGMRSARLAKGGSWRRRPEFARLNYEYWADVGSRADDVGFRIVRVAATNEVRRENG
jgi:hypothetical protein